MISKSVIIIIIELILENVQYGRIKFSDLRKSLKELSKDLNINDHI